MVTTTTAVQRMQTIPTRTSYVVNGRTVGLRCRGKGRIPVVFQAGGSTGGIIWTAGGLIPALGPNVFTCVFDRPGVVYGKFDAPTSPPLMTPRGIETALAGALKQAHIGPRVVLVGHSIGGLDSVVFGAEYPNLVAGAVLLDPSSPAALTGPIDRPEFVHLGIDPDPAAAQIRAIKKWPPVTMVVFTQDLKRGVAVGGWTPARAAAWSAWHKHYARLSKEGVERQIPGTDHNAFTIATSAGGKVAVLAIRRVLREAN